MTEETTLTAEQKFQRAIAIVLAELHSHVPSDVLIAPAELATPEVDAITIADTLAWLDKEGCLHGKLMRGTGLPNKHQFIGTLSARGLAALSKPSPLDPQRSTANVMKDGAKAGGKALLDSTMKAFVEFLAHRAGM